MRMKFWPAVSIGVAVVVFGSIAYAADRRKSAKTPERPGDRVREEEALKAELLGGSEKRDSRQSGMQGKKVILAERDDKKEAALLAEVARQ